MLDRTAHLTRPTPWREFLGDWLHRQPLVLIAIVAAIGILSDQWLHVAVWCWALIAAGLAGWAIAGPTKTRWWAAVLIALPGFAVRHHVDQLRFQTRSLLDVVDSRPSPAVIRGVIDRAPVLRRHPAASRLPPITAAKNADHRQWQSQFEVSVHAIRNGQRFEPVSGRVLVTAEGTSDSLQPGDRVVLYGSLRRFAGPTNPGQRDLREYYRRRNLHADLRLPDVAFIEVVRHPSTSWSTAWWRLIDHMAKAGRGSLLRHSDPQTGPLAMALVLGQRELVDRETRDLLLVTGTAHLLSVSGLHLAIVVLLTQWLATLMGLPRMGRVGLLVLVCVFYTAITGGRPPVVRAAVLVAALALSVIAHRPAQPLNSLGLAALVLCFWNPTLLQSVGVQLSFLAVATLVTVGGRSFGPSSQAQSELAREEQLDRLIDRSRGAMSLRLRMLIAGLWRALLYSGAVTLVSTPLVWYTFHVISPISVLANVTLGPMMLVALASGLLTIGLDLLSTSVAAPVGWLCHATLIAMRQILSVAAAVPGGHVWMPRPAGWWVAVFYVGVGIAAVQWQRHHRLGRIRKIGVLMASAWIAWMVFAWNAATQPARLPPSTLEAIFVDVGHGTAVILRFAEDDVWLYDCGHLGNDLGDSRGIDQAIWSLGIRRISGIIISHADADHFNALPGLLERFHVDRVVTPPEMLNEDETAVTAIRRSIARHRVQVEEWSAGHRFLRNGFRVTCLHPTAHRVPGSDNANSLVLQIERDGPPLILPGDLEPPGTQNLVNQPRPRPGGVVMAPHHGSLNADAKSVLQWCRPAWVVVSGGQRTERPEVIAAMAQVGSDVHLTHRDGAVRLRIGDSIDVKTWSSSLLQWGQPGQ